MRILLLGAQPPRRAALAPVDDERGEGLLTC
jgi:hypothetical protein